MYVYVQYSCMLNERGNSLRDNHKILKQNNFTVYKFYENISKDTDLYPFIKQLQLLTMYL
jgi:hypothetical protein